MTFVSLSKKIRVYEFFIKYINFISSYYYCVYVIIQDIGI